MPVPQVTFPLTQEEVAVTRKRVADHLVGLNADVRVCQELLKVIRALCKHPKRRSTCCLDCGEDWGD